MNTKPVILEFYAAMQQDIDTGEPYQTPLDPPIADPASSAQSQLPGEADHAFIP